MGARRPSVPHRLRSWKSRDHRDLRASSHSNRPRLVPPLRDERKLLVSNNDALYLFDIETQKVELVSDLRAIKCASQHLDGTLWASDPTEIEGAATWKSDAILRVRPKEPPQRYQNHGCRFYKARSW